MPVIRFDKLIDNYLPTHEGDLFHPDQTQELIASLGDDGLLHIDQQTDIEDYGVQFKQIGFISESDDGLTNPKVYYLNIVADDEDTDPLAIVSDLQASNARALKVTANHSLVFRTSYPYNPQTLKKMTVRLKAKTAGDIRVGIVGLSDKSYVKPDGTSGFPDYSSDDSDFYEVAVTASNSPATVDEYVTLTGYFKGLSATASANTYPADDPNTPVPLYDDVAHEHTTTDVALAVKCRSGEYWIDSLELFDVENSIADLPGGSDVLQTITYITSDGYLTPTEKRWLSPQFDAIVEEYVTIRAQAVVYSVDTTSFDTIFEALNDEILTNLAYLESGVYFTDLENTATFKSGTTGGLTYPEAFRKLWSDYWEARAIIQMEISAVPGEGVEAVLELITLDTNLTPAEKRWLKVQYDTIVLEYASIVAQALVYAIDDTDFDTVYNALYTELNTPTYLDSGTYLTNLDTVAVFKSGTTGGLTYPEAFRKLFSDYTDEKELLLQAISSASGTLARRLELTASTQIIDVSSRGDLLTEGILFTVNPIGVAIADVAWDISDGTLELVEIETGVYDDYRRQLDCSTVVGDATVITVTGTYGTDTYTYSLNVVKVYETPSHGDYVGMVDSMPPTTAIIGGKSFVNGDHLLFTGTTGSMYQQYHIYEYVDGAWHESTSNTHFRNASVDALEIAANTTDVVYAATAYIDKLFANNLYVRRELSVNYDEDEDENPTQGMKVSGADGILKAVGAVLVDADIRGLITSEPLSTQKTIDSGLKADATAPSNTLWDEATFYANFPVTATPYLQEVAFSYDGSSYTDAAKPVGQRIIFEEETGPTIYVTDIGGGNYFHIRTWVVPSGLPSGDNMVEISIGAGWHIAGHGVIQIYRGGVLFMEQTGNTHALAIRSDVLHVGDEIRIYWLGSTFTFNLEVWLNYVRAQTISTYTGIVALKSDNSLVTLPMQNNSVKYQNYAFSTTTPAWNVDSIRNRKSGTEIVSEFIAEGFPLGSFVQADGTLNGTDTIVGVRVFSTYVQFSISGGTTKTINSFVAGTSTGVYSTLSISDITTYAQKEAVITSNIYPKDATNDYDLGQAGVVVPGGTENRYYRNLYLKGTMYANDADLTGNLLTSAPSGSYSDIGTSGNKFRTAYLSGDAYIGNASIVSGVEAFARSSSASPATLYSPGIGMSGYFSTTSYVKGGAYKVRITGTVLFRLSVTAQPSGPNVYAKIYKNGSALGVEHLVYSDSSESVTETFTERLAVSAGDVIQIYGKLSSNSANAGYAVCYVYCNEEGVEASV